MIMNKSSIYVCWVCIAICLLTTLDDHVCFGQTGANAALYFLPTKINLYPNHGLTAGEAQDIIDDINQRFQDNDFPARLVNIGVETITADHGGNNNWGGDNGAGGGTAGDGDLTDAEGWGDNDSVSAYGDNEVQNLPNHKGIKVSFVNATHSGSIWPGWCFHCQPTIVVSLPRALDRANNENGRGLTRVEAAAETIMHELGHVIGDLSHGHTFGTGNFMTPSNTRTGTDMDDTQKDAMLENKYKHAKCVYQWRQNYPGIPLENLFGNGLDEILDVSGGSGDDEAAFLQNISHLDIQQIYLVGLDSSTQAVFDDTENINVHYRVAGALPTDLSIEANYTLGFDIDDDLSTGAIHGDRPGIDRVVTVLATGRISDDTFQLNGRVEDLVTGTIVSLPGVITYDIDRPFPDDTRLSEPTATIFHYKIPKNSLNWSVDDVPVVVTAGTPTTVRDTTEFIFETKRWQKDPLLQTFGDGVPIPGEPYSFAVSGLQPNSPFQLYLNDTLMLSGQLDNSGSYHGDFVFPPDLTTRDPHFLTVLDSTGEFAYGMACPNPSFADEPYPADGETYPNIEAILSWTPGISAILHDIYFGIDYDAVANADALDVTGIYRGRTQASSYIPPEIPLEGGQTYYWRIDEVEADGTIYVGDVWSFTITVDGPVAYYPLDGNAIDGSGNGNNGTIMGDPVFVSSVAGQAIDLDGDGDYIDCGAAEIFGMQETNEMTAAAWVSIRSIANQWAAIVAKGEYAWRLGNVSFDPRFHFGISIWNAPDTATLDGVTAVSFDEWHHVAGIYDGASINVYLDGALDASVPTTEPIGANEASVLIGENPEATGRYWDGFIDEVYIYNRALSQDELLLLAQ